MEWNQIALAATVTAGQAPIVQIRTMAIVQVSVHDAVNAITCHYRTYLSISCGPWGSPEAAAIAAAHRALVGLFPAQAAALNVARAGCEGLLAGCKGHFPRRDSLGNRQVRKRAVRLGRWNLRDCATFFDGCNEFAHPLQ
jgi:hypothetical protein